MCLPTRTQNEVCCRLGGIQRKFRRNFRGTACACGGGIVTFNLLSVSPDCIAWSRGQGVLGARSERDPRVSELGMDARAPAFRSISLRGRLGAFARSGTDSTAGAALSEGEGQISLQA